jgi:very-short-patch-repair endonuclease
MDVIDSAGLPRPTKQRPVIINGRFRRLDFTYVAERVVIEADGRKTHDNDDAYEDDRERDNALIARGWYVLRWTWKALHAVGRTRSQPNCECASSEREARLRRRTPAACTEGPFPDPSPRRPA